MFDYSQIEPRLTAYFADKIGFPEFAARLRTGEDAYTAVAQMITGKEDVTNDERQIWKRIFLMTLYGAGVRAVRTAWIEMTKENISEAQAKRMIKTFHVNWPAVMALQDDVQRVALKRGYLRALDGRHLRPEPYGEHKLLNKLIQGSAAGVMKQAILDVHQHLGGFCESHAVSVIHDELILDGPVHELEHLHQHVPALMSAAAGEAVNEIVPILVEHEVSLTSWAEKQPYEEVVQAEAAELPE